jgi:3-hydroxyisobutyrate dehydrogenase-like beta-hydroxyacid dehydrogenase
MERIAFIGLGAMGEPMAANLLRHGFGVTVVGHRRPEPVERLRAKGAEVAGTPAKAGRRCGIVVLMLPSSREVEAVVADGGGLADALAAGGVVIDCSTSDPSSTQRLAAMLASRGSALVDAPVTRGMQGAKDGKLAFFVGCGDQEFERVKPALAAMGDTFYRMGGVGTGHATKILTNALSYGTVALVGETLMLADRLGLDLQRTQEALMAGAASKALESFGPRIIGRQYASPRVSIANARDHLEIARKLVPADEASLDVLSAARALYERVGALGHGASDMSSIAELWPARPGSAPAAGRAAS